MKRNFYLGLFLLVAGIAHGQTIIPPGDYLGADIVMASGQSLTGGHYSNVGNFIIPSGVSIPIAKNTGVVRITANQITIGGILNGNAAGFIGGIQAACPGANPGITGSGPGGGTGGAFGPNVHGNGGAGGGYGGNGGNSGNALDFPAPGLGGVAYGDISSSSIEMGSGGGSGSNYFNCQSIGGRGGAGGGGIHLESPNITITGQVNARGENGFAGTRQTPSNIFASGGAGSGGGVLIVGGGVISGSIDVNGGNGGNSPNSGLSIGGGGGGGGRIKIYGSFTTTSAILRANGGLAGTSVATAQSQSNPGQAGTITIVTDTPTIETQAMEFSEFCAGTENVSVHFDITGDFGTSNVFTAQLSDGTGSFTNPVNIGTSTTSGLIAAILPADLTPGSGFRVRVISSQPEIIGSDNGADLTINGLPTAALSGGASICPGSSASLTVDLTGASPWNGIYNDGTNDIAFSATVSPLVLTVSPSETTEYSLVSVSDANCNGSVSGTAVISVEDFDAPVPDVAELPTLTAQCSATATPPTATDNCKGLVTATTEDPTTFDTQGTFTITWTYSDDHGNASTQQQTVIIHDTEAPVLPDPLTDITAQCEVTLTVLPTAVDNCAATVTATTEDALTYDEDGTYTIHWKFDDGNGNILEATQTVIVDDTEAPVPSTAVLPDVTGECSAAVSIVPAATDNCAGDLLATTTDPVSYTVPGAYIITWTFDDGNGNTTQQTQNVIIEDNTSPVIPELTFEISSASTAGVCGRVVTFEDPAPTDNCGVTRFERTDDTGLESGDVFPEGTTVISYEAEDAAGNVTEASFSITIVNDAPVITSVSGPTEAKPVNTFVTLTAQFIDDNASSATITWGDGAVTTGTLSGTTLTAQHQYTDAGVYSVLMELTDACGEVATSTFTIVIFDQNAGHVTGAGLFNSPRDAYRSDRHVSCIGAFELNVKYKNGRSVPEGKTEFRLLASNLRFKSTSYEWLVIDGDHATYKGKGELNGQTGYSFLVSAIDAGKLVDNNTHQWNFIIDKFRIKIWNATGVVIYDNQQGAADNADPITPILGSIVIHKGKKQNSTPGLRRDVETVSEISLETSLSVFPNPFVDIITVQLDPIVKVNPTIQLFDNSGRPLYEKEHLYQESGTYSVNVGDAAAKTGLYLLRVSQGNRVEVIKVFGGAR